MGLFGHGFFARNQNNASSDQQKQVHLNKKEISQFSNTELLSKFKTEQWDTLDKDSRLGVVQEIENRNAAQQQREPARVKFENLREGTNGCFSGKSIYINYKSLQKDQFGLLSTYYHESRHAQQSYSPEAVVGTRAKLGSNAEDFPNKDRVSGINYVKADDSGVSNSFLIYRSQISEMDSNNYALSKMLEHNEMFKNDPRYTSYLEDAKIDYNYLNERFDTVQYDRAEILNKNLKDALNHKLCDDKTYFEQKYMNSVPEKDELVIQSKKLEETLDSKLQMIEDEKNTEENAVHTQQSSNSDGLIARMTQRGENSEGNAEATTYEQSNDAKQDAVKSNSKTEDAYKDFDEIDNASEKANLKEYDEPYEKDFDEENQTIQKEATDNSEYKVQDFDEEEISSETQSSEKTALSESKSSEKSENQSKTDTSLSSEESLGQSY